ncbi:MAG TPA: hypothetical protein PKD61_03420 [Polyangiaceae bacterium]|nr:hypothetical protein [Polyangiaceae bacterium]
MRIHAIMLIATVAGSGCGEIHENCLAACSESVRFDGEVPLALDALETGSIRACVGWRCVTARLAEPLPPNAPAGSRFLLTPHGEASVVDPQRTAIRLKVVPSSKSSQDVVRLSVDNALGTPLFEFHRTVDYNYHSVCGQRCRRAHVQFDPTSSSGLHCSAHKCDSGFRLQTTLQHSPSELEGATVKLCWNATCNSGAAAFTAVDSLQSYPGSVHHGALFGPLQASFELTFDKGFSFSVGADVPSSQLSDGDTWSVEIKSKTDSMLFRHEQVVTYSENYPNGQACDVVPCRYSSVDVP